MEAIIEIPVRSTEVDFLGHVNNAKYLEYMEWGREDWYLRAGCSFDSLLERGLGTVTVNINIDYLGMCFKGDLLQVKTAPVKVGRTSFVLLQRIFRRENEQKVIEAQVTTVIYDFEKKAAVSIPGELLKRLRA